MFVLNNGFISQEFGDLTITFTGKQNCPSEYSCSWELPGEYLIHYILDGKGTFKCRGKEYRLEAGNAFFISDERGYYCADSKLPWTYIWIRFSGEIGKKFIETIGLSIENPIYKTDNPEMISKAFEELLALQQQNNEFLMLGQFLTLLGEMIKYDSRIIDVKKRPAKQHIKICQNFVAMNHHTKITASDLAEITGVEYSYLFKIFKQYLNISPGDYIINYKLAKAADYLLKTSQSVSQISAAVGYEDRVAFSKLFKKKYGVSPQKYRQKN